MNKNQHALRICGLAALLLCLSSGCATKAPLLASTPVSWQMQTDWQTPNIKRVSAPKKILFFGNSFIYYNNSMHNHLSRLVRSGLPAGKTEPRMRSATISGGHLAEHAATFESLVDSDNWDTVVMQGHSLGPISDKTSRAFHAAANLYSSYLHRKDIQPVFFMTWAYTNKPDMTQALASAYTQTANYNQAIVAPVGLAFAWVTNRHPQIALRTSDQRHPTLAGSYLAACVFYVTLYGQSPVGLSYTAGLDADTVNALQTAAQHSTQDFFKR